MLSEKAKRLNACSIALNSIFTTEQKKQLLALNSCDYKLSEILEELEIIRKTIIAAQTGKDYQN